MEATELLLACHERIRRFTGGLLAIAEHLPSREERVVQTARQCARYFSEALPLHAADEEESLLPRLRGSLADSALARLEEEHTWIAEQIPVIVADLQAIERGENPPGFASRAAEFTARLRAHITAEESDIFPEIATLSAEERAEVVREIRARRKVQQG